MKNIIMGVSLLFLFFAGCSVRYLEESADRQVYRIIDEKKERIKTEILPDAAIPVTDDTSSETVVLELKDAIVLAVKNNRNYKSMEEDVYLNILDLTYQRYLYGNRYSLGGNLYWNKGDDESVSGTLSFGILRWLAMGTQLTFDITKDFISYLTGDKDTDIQTIISMNILQPLLRGAGRKIAQEDLIQSERNAVYEIRSFMRYRKGFSIDTTEQFLEVILSKSRIENFYNNYISLKSTRERIEMLANAGRLPALQVDQARQNEYAAYQRWVNARNSYSYQMDSLKIHLGLPTESVLILDEELLKRLVEAGVTIPEFDLRESIRNALRRRMDLLTDYDRVEDAKREITIALDNLKPEVDLVVYSTGSTESKPHPTFDFTDFSYGAGIEFDLPLDRLPDRNRYRSALIDLNRQQRNFENKRDTVILEVYQQYRNMEEYYQSYLIQKNSLLLAERRIESTDLLLQAGRATTRDVLEAEESYLSAKNDLASAVVNYITAYLRFLYSAGYLQVDDEGIWEGNLYEKITKKTV
jgi:outer membrane protein TolC